MATNFERNWQDARNVHIMPQEDILPHEPDEDCPCLPLAEYVSGEGVYSGAWLYTHNSWKGDI